MITKEQFVSILDNIKKQDEKNEKFGEAVEAMSDSWCIWGCDDLYKKSLMDLLKTVMEDEGDLISWWLYEDVEKVIWLPDGTEIDISTPEKLYDLLAEEEKEDAV